MASKKYGKCWSAFQKDWCADLDKNDIVVLPAKAGECILLDASFNYGVAKSARANSTRYSVFFRVVSKNTKVYHLANFFQCTRDTSWDTIQIVQQDEDLYFVDSPTITMK